MKTQYLECGKIINTHGVKGAVKVESYCDSPKVLASLGTVYCQTGKDYKPVKVLHASIFKQFVLMELAGITDIDMAISWKGTVIYADREDLPLASGAYFIADLIGLPVLDADNGHVYGTLKEVINRGASDIYVIDTEAGERMMPAVDEFVKNIDPDKGILISPIEGMLD